MKFIIGKEFDKKFLYVVTPLINHPDCLVIAKNGVDAREIAELRLCTDVIAILKYWEKTILLAKGFITYEQSVDELLGCLPCGIIGNYLERNSDNKRVYYLGHRYSARLG